MAFQVGAFQLDAFQQEAGSLVTVPDVVGQTQASGTAELEAALFAVAVVTAYSSTVPAGTIISQSPAAGVDAPEGSTVTITVSLGERSGAGSSKSRHRRRYYVEINGQQFPVSGAEEAQHLLMQARAAAERQAEAEADRVVKKLSRKRRVPVVKIEAPTVTVSPEIKLDLAPLIADINRLYERAAMNAELRLRFEQMKRADDDEEDDLLLLL